MKNVYRTPEEKRKYSRCSIPEELRATEKHIDILRAGWKKFGIRIRAVSRITGIKQARIYQKTSRKPLALAMGMNALRV